MARISWHNDRNKESDAKLENEYLNNPSGLIQSNFQCAEG